MNDGVRMAPGFSSSEQDKTALRQVATFAAKRGIPLEIHAYTDDSADAILTIFEQVAQQYDLRPLRWSIAHLNTGSPQTLERMRKLGLAFTVQMGPYFEGLPSVTPIHPARRTIRRRFDWRWIKGLS